MLRWLTVLFVLAVITGLLGFTSLFGNTVGLARNLFVIYVGLAMLTLTVSVFRR